MARIGDQELCKPSQYETQWTSRMRGRWGTPEVQFGQILLTAGGLRVPISEGDAAALGNWNSISHFHSLPDRGK